MNIRRLQLDVDKAISRPDLLDLAEAIEAVSGVEAVNITVAEIDIETVGMEVTVEGELIDASGLVRAIECPARGEPAQNSAAVAACAGRVRRDPERTDASVS